MKALLFVALCATLVQSRGVVTTLVSDAHVSRHLLQNTEAVGESIAVGGEGQGAAGSAQAQAATTTITPSQTTRDCLIYDNTNYSGALIVHTFSPTVETCCNICRNREGCNVFVHCPQASGCDDGSGRIYPGFICSLKYQTLEEGTDPTAYARGPNVPWVAGIITTTSFGGCIGSSTAAASAATEAGCGSVAYARGVAEAIDKCGGRAYAEALSISVGGRCPITCDEAINVAQQASCGSDEFNEAENTAVALCGSFEYTQRTGDFGICPPETTPTCEGTVQALARAIATAGCNSIATAKATAFAVNACGASAFAEATATAIGPDCPVFINCGDAVTVARARAEAQGCGSQAFAFAEAKAISLCGAESYASAAASASGGICEITGEPVRDDPVPDLAEDQGAIPQPPAGGIITPAPVAEEEVDSEEQPPTGGVTLAPEAEELLTGIAPVVERPVRGVAPAPEIELPLAEAVPAPEVEVQLPVVVGIAPAPEVEEEEPLAEVTIPAPAPVVEEPVFEGIAPAPEVEDIFVGGPVPAPGDEEGGPTGVVAAPAPEEEEGGPTGVVAAPAPEEEGPTSVVAAPAPEEEEEGPTAGMLGEAMEDAMDIAMGGEDIEEETAEAVDKGLNEVAGDVIANLVNAPLGRKTGEKVQEQQGEEGLPDDALIERLASGG